MIGVAKVIVLLKRVDQEMENSRKTNVSKHAMPMVIHFRLEVLAVCYMTCLRI